MKKYIPILWLCALNAGATSLDQQYSGFFKCETDTYMDQLTGRAHGRYFEERKLKPCKINDEVASFCVNDSYQGLPISRIDIPNNFSLVLFRIDKKIEYVRNYLRVKNKIKLGSEQNFTKPYIMKDPDNRNKTLIICDLEP